MGGRGALLGLGTLHQLEVLDPKTKRVRSLYVRNKWLAWDPKRRAFHICRLVRAAAGRGLGGVAALHRRFHEAGPSRAVVVDVPTPAGAIRQMGLLRALTYRVPKKTKSPGKNPYTWHHAFGDTGHQGGDKYPERVMPALLCDSKGNLFIQRRPGNIFRVDTWLRG